MPDIVLDQLLSALAVDWNHSETFKKIPFLELTQRFQFNWFKVQFRHKDFLKLSR